MKRYFFYLMTILLLAVGAISCTKAGGSPSTTTAAFTAAAGPNLTVTFTNTSVNIGTDTWDFGDGTTSTDVSPVHKYAVAGTYTVKLVVIGKDGVTKNMTHTVQIA